MAQRQTQGTHSLALDDEQADYEAWNKQLGGHRPHAWMRLLMSLYDVCVWQSRQDEREYAHRLRDLQADAEARLMGQRATNDSYAGTSVPAPAYVLPRKVDMYLLYGLRKKPADFSRDIDQTTSWLVHKQVLKGSLALMLGIPTTGDDVERCADLIGLAVGQISTVWRRVQAASPWTTLVGGKALLERADTAAERMTALEALKADDQLSQALLALAPEMRPAWAMVGEVPSATLGKRLDDAYARTMQMVTLSRAICSPSCVLRLLDLLDNRGYAEELSFDFPDGSYLSLAGLSADFALSTILQHAETLKGQARWQASASVVGALAVMSAIGPTRLAELEASHKRHPTSPVADYFELMGAAEAEAAPSTMVIGAEHAEGHPTEALTLAQVTYDSYESPLDARGPVVPSHAPIPLERGKVYYLGREVEEQNFANETEREAFIEDAGQAVVVRIRPATKTSVARAHAKIYFDREAGGWVFYALRNRATAQLAAARTLVIDPNDRVLDATLLRKGKAGKAFDHTTHDSGTSGPVRLRRSAYLWLGPKMVEGADGSIRWAPDEIRGAVFVVRGA